MILYHIQTNPKEPFKPGEIINVGKEQNRLIEGCYNFHSCFTYDTYKNEEEKTVSYFKSLRRYSNPEMFNQLTPEQQKRFFEDNNRYIKKMEIAKMLEKN